MFLQQVKLHLPLPRSPIKAARNADWTAESRRKATPRPQPAFFNRDIYGFHKHGKALADQRDGKAVKPKQARVLLEALVHQEEEELKQAPLGALLPCLCHQQHHRGRRPGPGCRHRCAPGGGPAASSWRPEGGAEGHMSGDAFDGRQKQLDEGSGSKNYTSFWPKLVPTETRGRVQNAGQIPAWLTGKIRGKGRWWIGRRGRDKS